MFLPGSPLYCGLVGALPLSGVQVKLAQVWRGALWTGAMLQAWKVVLLCFALVSVFSVGQVSAGFNYTLNGNQYYATAVQLWYEGYWKEVRVTP